MITKDSAPILLLFAYQAQYKNFGTTSLLLNLLLHIAFSHDVLGGLLDNNALSSTSCDRLPLRSSCTSLTEYIRGEGSLSDYTAPDSLEISKRGRQVCCSS